jgi:hypothetical protein
MKMIEIQSSSLAAVGYDPAVGTLRAVFHNGKSYRYFKVPEQLFADLMGAKSKGGFFNRYIRDRFFFEEERPKSKAAPY